MYSFLTPYKTDNLIRIGSINDGGYVITKDIINNVNQVLSWGIYYNWDFESDLLKEGQIKQMILADPFTPIASLKSMINLRHRFKSNIGIVQNNLPETQSKRRYIIFLKKIKLYIVKYITFHFFLFFKRRIVEFVSLGLESYNSKEMRTLEFFIQKLKDANNLLIKMDIEGSEYNVDFSNKIFKNVQCLLIEFHNIDDNYDRLKEIINELQNNNLYIYHIHLNNSSLRIKGSQFSKAVELSFQQRKYFGKSLEKVSCTYPLDKIDSPCDPNKDDYTLFFE
ncbi:MAG: hypothetical protein L3J45_00940 [Flavobacteriaceae bacterium]|nr:hypothetical protein [Flavobacteriaceae bacterium]